MTIRVIGAKVEDIVDHLSNSSMYIVHYLVIYELRNRRTIPKVITMDIVRQVAVPSYAFCLALNEEQKLEW